MDPGALCVLCGTDIVLLTDLKKHNEQISYCPHVVQDDFVECKVAAFLLKNDRMDLGDTEVGVRQN